MKTVLLIFCPILVFAACAQPKQTEDASGSLTNDVRSAAIFPPPHQTSTSDNEETETEDTDDTSEIKKLHPREILDAMNAIRNDVEACNKAGIRGTVKIEFKILADGSIESAEALDAHASTDIGNCIAGIVSRSNFRATGEVMNITFPFKFQ